MNFSILQSKLKPFVSFRKSSVGNPNDYVTLSEARALALKRR